MDNKGAPANLDIPITRLFNELGDPPPYESRSQYQGHLLEQYKLYVTMADNISSRRLTASSFFLSVNTAIIAVVAYLNMTTPSAPPLRFLWLVAAAGIVICYMWYRLIRSYKDLNNAKFRVIHEIEKRLPISPYDAEWEAVGRGKDRKRYLPFTHIEVAIPWVFLVFHTVVLIASTPALSWARQLARCLTA